MKQRSVLICVLCVEAIPDLTPLLKPTTLGDFATYFLAAAGGLFLGGELGKIVDRMMPS